VQDGSAEYFGRVREICDKYGVLLIIDEVITGFGRAGTWFASEQMDIKPDIMTMAKAMTAGYMPMGAVVARPELIDALPVYRHVHTYSGHAGAAAAANTVIAIKERENLVERGREMGEYMLDSLHEFLDPHPIVGDVRGKGMWLAVDFTADKETRAPFTDDTVKAVVARMYEHGVIASAIGTSFEMAPPLISTKADLDEAVRVTAQAINEIAAERKLV
jgi:putrescine aminotransferase